MTARRATDPHAPSGRPARDHGNPWREHDACGVGFVAQPSGERSARIVRLALQALARVAHRGAAATDSSGDGAGLLTQIPVSFFRREAARLGLALAPRQPFAVGVVFLPHDSAARSRGVEIIEQVLAEGGLAVLGWRDIPVDVRALGTGARASCPAIRQVLVGTPTRRADEAASATRRAIGRPALAMTMSSPAAARSRRCDRCVATGGSADVCASGDLLDSFVEDPPSALVLVGEHGAGRR